MLISLKIPRLNLEVYEKRKQMFAVDFWLSCVSLYVLRPTSLREKLHFSQLSLLWFSWGLFMRVYCLSPEAICFIVIELGGRDLHCNCQKQK